MMPRNMRSARAHVLAEVAAKGRLSFARRFLGKIVEIVSESDSRCCGRTSEYLPCEAKGPAPRRSLANVLVTKVNCDGSLEGIVR